MAKRMMKYEQLAEMLELPLGTVYSLKSRGQIPFVQLGPRLVRFDEDEIRAWIDERRSGTKQRHGGRGGRS